MRTRSDKQHLIALLSLLSVATLGCAASAEGRPQELRGESLEHGTTPQANPSTAELRALGPEGLARALAHFDRLPEGEAKRQQARRVDEVAAQRYATSSRLYWYTDLEAAKSDASSKGRPILSLRMLGRLDEDFSCANSRMFRTVLYANQEVSSYLRDNFTLHWSSEREVPKITVDFGEGRVLKSTIAGNSAHYLLTGEGQPIDVLPGLYAPKAFLQALAPGLQLAEELSGSDKDEELIRRYHRAAIEKERSTFAKLSPAQRKALNPYREPQAGDEIVVAEMLTVSKMAIEMPMARSLAAEATAPPDAAAVRDSVTSAEPLDTSSRELIVAMGPTDWGASPTQLSGSALDALFRKLEMRVAADTLINRHGLHPQIHMLFVGNATPSFTVLNARIYAEIFVTPASDPWLGMAQPEGFSGLPGDGLAVR